MKANKSISEPIGLWSHPAVISANNFVHKSLSNWSLNIAIGCGHGCRFCYVPSSSTNKQAQSLSYYGVTDPDAEWGSYVLLRQWDENKFLASLRAAEKTPLADLNPDGNRAVMLCTTTDPYQVFHHPDPARAKELTQRALTMVQRALELIRDESTINVRIMTRSPLAREHFDLFRTFGPRLLFGMSLPTLRNDLAKVYEPQAPAPSARLATLRRAHEGGLNVYVAMAPTYPECDEADLRQTLTAIKDLGVVTIFHEPINIRADNVERIAEQAHRLGITLHTEVFASRESWKDYSLHSLKTVVQLCEELGISDRLHLWPDKKLGAKWAVDSMPRPEKYRSWLEKKWARISEWPRTKSPTAEALLSRL
jgi:DNA repair photolyase